MNTKKVFCFLLLLLLLSGCLNPVKHLNEVSPASPIIRNPYFGDPEKDYVYKAKIEAYGRSFGGLFIVKKLADEYHRLVFTTEFGNKIFDFEFRKETFKTNFIIPDLDRKFIVKTLQRDFRILLQERSKVIGEFDGQDLKVYQTNQDNRRNYYYVSTESGKLLKISHQTALKEKIRFEFEPGLSSLAQRIRILHQSIKLKIELRAL